MKKLWDNFISDWIQQNSSPVLAPLLKRTALVHQDGEIVSIACENQGMQIFLETKKKTLEKEFANSVGKPIKIQFVIKKKPKKAAGHNSPLPFPKETDNNREEKIKKAMLQGQLTFDNFAVSSSNQIAYTAGVSVAEKIGTTYNPLFIYGGVGVGKTHLMHAIGNQILAKNPSQKVLYCTSEEFTNDLIELIREKNTGRFRKKYRSLAVLLIDDIQFIAGKNYIQEELYHTFNTIIKNGGQIVLTSDRPPKEIHKLEDRLRSRFSGGLTIDIQKPDLELRSAILLIKAQERNIAIDIEAAKQIAERVADARELEGKLLEFWAKLVKKDQGITNELIQNELNKNNQELKKRVDHADVTKAVCLYYNVRVSHLRGPSRKEQLAQPRQIVMYLLRTLLNLKYEEIAFLLKRKDHTTIIHGVEKISALTIKNPNLKEEIDRIINSLPPSTN